MECWSLNQNKCMEPKIVIRKFHSHLGAPVTAPSILEVTWSITLPIEIWPPRSLELHLQSSMLESLSKTVGVRKLHFGKLLLIWQVASAHQLTILNSGGRIYIHIAPAGFGSQGFHKRLPSPLDPRFQSSCFHYTGYTNFNNC